MKTIYVVRTANFTDTLYFETFDAAADFAQDQIDMDFNTTLRVHEVSSDEFDRLMATMQELDAGAAKFFAEHAAA